MKDPFQDFEKTNHPDDVFFKKVMSKKSSVQAYLKNFSPDISDKLDLNSLEDCNESFINEQLDLFESDIVYRCKVKDSEQKIYISFIWEHKSSPETYVSLQIGLYIFLALYKMSKQTGRKIEIILPFLFYNGATNWQPKTVHDLFKNVPQFEYFKKYIPQYNFLFKNIVSANDLELLSIQDSFFRSAMFAMASRNNAELIIERILHIFGTGDDNEILVLLNYILHFTQKNEVDLKEAIIKTDSPLKNKIMSTIEQLEEKYTRKGIKLGVEKGIGIGVEKGIGIGVEKGIGIGVEKGIGIGVEKGIELSILRLDKKGISIEKIADLFDLDVSNVIAIINKANKNNSKL